VLRSTVIARAATLVIIPVVVLLLPGLAWARFTASAASTLPVSTARMSPPQAPILTWACGKGSGTTTVTLAWRAPASGPLTGYSLTYEAALDGAKSPLITSSSTFDQATTSATYQAPRGTPLNVTYALTSTFQKWSSTAATGTARIACP
jgi:hypothetical protein